MKYDIEPGTFRVIRVDGTEAIFEGKVTLDEIYGAIGCALADTVRIDHERDIIMLVDDLGIIVGKPINPKATELYRSICREGMQTGFIRGDVALVNDSDFE